jgi:hypothetical protein
LVFGRRRRIYNSGHSLQYTSLAFGHRLHEAGLLGSVGSIADCYNSIAESFFATLQTELLDRSAQRVITAVPTPRAVDHQAVARPTTLRAGEAMDGW